MSNDTGIEVDIGERAAPKVMPQSVSRLQSLRQLQLQQFQQKQRQLEGQQRPVGGNQGQRPSVTSTQSQQVCEYLAGLTCILLS